MVVQEQCQSGTLGRVLEHCELSGSVIPLLQRIRLLRHVAAALQHLHSQGFVHGSIGASTVHLHSSHKGGEVAQAGERQDAAAAALAALTQGACTAKLQWSGAPAPVGSGAAHVFVAEVSPLHNAGLCNCGTVVGMICTWDARSWSHTLESL